MSMVLVMWLTSQTSSKSDLLPDIELILEEEGLSSCTDAILLWFRILCRYDSLESGLELLCICGSGAVKSVRGRFVLRSQFVRNESGLDIICTCTTEHARRLHACGANAGGF